MKQRILWLFLSVLSVFLTACGGKVTQEDMDNARGLCVANNGLVALSVTTQYEVECVNGAKFILQHNEEQTQ